MKTVIATLMVVAGSIFADCPTPTPPPNVSVIALSPYAARFQVNPVTPPTAGYVAERKREGGIYKVINTGYPGGVINDTYELLPGIYWYKTRARTPCNNYTTLSVYTPEVMVLIPDGPPPNQGAPEPPTNLVATATSSRVMLGWQAGAFQGVPGQTQIFQVQRSVNGGLWSVVNLTTQTSLADNNVQSGQTIDYRGRSFNPFGWTTEMPFDCAPNKTDCGTAFTNVASVTIP